jgi:flagellar hook-basal body complex protein FliE
MAIVPLPPIGVDVIELYRSMPNVAGTGGAEAAGPSGSFTGLLADKLNAAQRIEAEGSAAAQAVAAGTATDIAAATMAVEKAAIAMQLTGAIRNKAVEAYQDVMRMQI